MGPESWIKLDPIALGAILESLPDVVACGEWLLGFQAGACGAALSKTARPHEAAGHAHGREALRLRDSDKARITEKRQAAGAKGAASKWQTDGKGMANGNALPSSQEWQTDGKGMANGNALPSSQEWQTDGKPMAEERRGDILTDKTPLSPPPGDDIERPPALPNPVPAPPTQAQRATATRQAKSDTQAIYAAYPRKDGLGKTECRAIEKAVAEVGVEPLLEAIRAYAAAVAKWPSEDRKQFVPMIATWLNGRRWEADRSTWERHAAADPQVQRKADERNLAEIQNRCRTLDRAESALDAAVRIRGSPANSPEVQTLVTEVLRAAQHRREIDSRPRSPTLSKEALAVVKAAAEARQKTSQQKRGES